jgi:hypothetical protein
MPFFVYFMMGFYIFAAVAIVVVSVVDRRRHP